MPERDLRRGVFCNAAADFRRLYQHTIHARVFEFVEAQNPRNSAANNQNVCLFIPAKRVKTRLIRCF